MVHPRVLGAMAQPLVGHLDPMFLALLDGVQRDLRRLFGTANELTVPLSGTGSAGMEASLANLIEEDDEVVVGIHGVFGTRMAEIAERLGARVVRVDAPWGEIVPVERLAQALENCRAPKLLAIVHAETSTGVWQPLGEISALVHAREALLIVDAVTSLGGCPVGVDRDGWDVCYSATQKCLGCPPGLAPVTFGPRAVERIRQRRRKPPTWYLDLNLIQAYFGGERVYHHTAPISMVYALAKSLELVFEEGLDARYERHRVNHLALLAGLAALGIRPVPAEGHRLWMLNAVRIPQGVEDNDTRRRLLMRHSIEIGAGLGPLAGKVWRVGLMGESSRAQHVRRFLLALAQEFPASALPSNAGRDAVEAADAVYAGACVAP
jgi:alanine-glyoxylate transaminase/serine-glyoxylate transaminase/serine-pyruvate transaminase